MAQCSTQIAHGSEAEFRQCRRHSVAGSERCQAHGGVEDSQTPDRVRVRKENRNQVRCTATSRRTGVLCQSKAVLGGNVCRHHGGAAPQTMAKARERMGQLVAPAIAELQQILTKSDTSDSDRLRAITLLLDRTGFGPKSEIGVEVKKYEEIAVSIMRELPEELEVAEIVDDGLAAESIVLNAEGAQNNLQGLLVPAIQEAQIYPEPIRLFPRQVGAPQPPRHLR